MVRELSGPLQEEWKYPAFTLQLPDTLPSCSTLQRDNFLPQFISCSCQPLFVEPMHPAHALKAKDSMSAHSQITRPEIISPDPHALGMCFSFLISLCISEIAT